jgi:hypothetical protein
LSGRELIEELKLVFINEPAEHDGGKVMKLRNLTKTIGITGLSLAALLGVAQVSNAQGRRVTNNNGDRTVKRQQDWNRGSGQTTDRQDTARTTQRQDTGRTQRQDTSRQDSTRYGSRQTTDRQNTVGNDRGINGQDRWRADQQRQGQLRQEQLRLERERLERERANNNRYNDRDRNNDRYRNNGYYGNNNGYYGNTGVYGQRYRINRGGSYYQTDYRGYSLLRQAMSYGYEQGYREGQMDRQRRRNGGFYNSSIYRSGNFGYQSWVDSGQYQYYFQQGFQRGYEDGYYSRYNYGYYNNGTFTILGSIVDSILRFEQY